MKNVIYWDCKTVQNGDKQSGVFSTRVAANSTGARRDKGSNAAGIEWDNWYRDATAIRGKLRWLDVVLPTYTGAKAQVVMLFENEKAVHRIATRYDASTCHQIINHFWGLGKGLPDHFFQAVGYEVYPKKQDKKPVLNDKGQIIYNKHLSFADVKPHFTYEAWKDYEQTHGLQWKKVRRAGGKEEWDTSDALMFWDKQIISIQRMLLKAGTALPFSYGSLIVTAVENPSGGGNLTADEIEECQRIYERERDNYKMPFGRKEIDADSVLDEPMGGEYQSAATDPGAEYQEAETANFPFDEPPVQAEQPANFDDQDLPF